MHPTAYFASWNDHPPFGAAELLLLVLSLAWGLAMEGIIVPRGTRKLRSSRTREWMNLIGVPLVVQLTWVCATFVSFGLVRMLSNGSSFELIFSVFAFAGTPCIIAWITFTMGGISYVAWVCWQFFSVLLHISAVWLVCVGLHTACHLNVWETILAAMPLLIPLLAIEVIQSMPKSADTFQSCYPWRRTSGKKVIVYYAGRKARQEIEGIVTGADETLRKLYDLLGQEALRFKVMIFLCRDEGQHRKIFYGKHDAALPMPTGCAHHDSISLVYGPWQDIAGAVAHEFCHIVRRHRISLELLGILDEGLSTYAEEKLFPGGSVPAITLVPNLQIVANTSVFFEWRDTKKPALSSTYCYRHAHALADYLISRHGMPRYLELCRVIGASKEATEGARLATAIEEIYGVPITEIEKLWRTTWPGTWTTGQTRLDLEALDENGTYDLGPQP